MAIEIIQTTNFIIKNFLTKDTNLLGTAFDADSDGVEGKYYVYNFNELKNIKDIEKFFDIKSEGN